MEVCADASFQFYLVMTLLRCNSHAIKFALLTRKMQWFSVKSEVDELTAI